MPSIRRNNWEIIQLGDAASFINGFAFKPKDWNTEGLEIIRIQNLTKGDASFNYFSGEIPDKYRVKNNDLLISWSATLGIYTWEGNDAWLNQHIFKVVFDKKSFDKQFFKYLISQSLVKMSRETHGSTMKHITKPRFDSFKIPYPPLPEQKKIAEILDAADKLRQKDQQLIEHYNSLSQSLFLEMFGDPIINPMGWEKVSLEKVSNKITDGTHQSPKFLSQGIPFLLVSNISNNKIIYETKKFISVDEYKKLTKNTPIEKGDILYTSVGSYGNPAIIESDIKFCFQRHIAQIKLKHELVNVVYIHGMMLTEYIKRQADRLAIGAAQKTLNLKSIKSMKILIPPIELQNQFAEHIKSIETQKQYAQASLKKSTDLFNCLLQKAFKGELI